MRTRVPGVDTVGWEGRQEAERGVRLLMAPDGWHEVTALPSRHPSVWLVGGDVGAILSHAARLDGMEWKKGVYFTLNPARASKVGAANDGDIVCRRWLFLDFDAHGEKGTNATEEGREEAADTLHRCREWLRDEKGFSEPVIVDSGNGFYLLYRLDSIPADAVSRAVVHRATQAIGSIYGLTVDAKVTNASRIARLPGTMNRRGPHTDERPQRRCRIVSVPESLECVPWDAVVALAGPERAKAPKTGGRKHKVPGGGKGYGAKALAEVIAELRLATEPGRNTALFKSAVRLYELALGGELTEAEADEALWAAIRYIGLDSADEIRTTERTLKSARESAEPRSAPVIAAEARSGEAKKEKSGAVPEKVDDDDPVFYPSSDVVPCKVRWLWPDRIPLGKLTTFAGMGGLGKTFVLLDIAARVSTGGAWPDGTAAERGTVLFVSGEDTPNDTLVPRLIELQADRSRILLMTDKSLSKFTLADVPRLEAGLKLAGGEASLIVIDPPTAFLGGVNDNNNAELRQILHPLKLLAERAGAALIFNTHINKGGGGNVEAMCRVMSSVAWVNTVRAAHLFAKDRDDQTRRMFLPLKTNLGPPTKGLGYQVKVTDALATVEWLGDVDTTADQAMGAAKKVTRDERAAEFLVERFREKLLWPSKDLFHEAKQHGIIEKALFEAKALFADRPKASKITHDSGTVEWVWSVPKDWSGFTKAAPEKKADGAEASY